MNHMQVENLIEFAGGRAGPGPHMAEAEAQASQEARKRFFQSLKVGEMIIVTWTKRRQGEKNDNSFGTASNRYSSKITQGRIIQASPKLITYNAGNYKLSVSLNDYLIRGYEIKRVEAETKTEQAGNAETNKAEVNEVKTPTAPDASTNAVDIRHGEDMKALWEETGNVFDLAEKLGVSSTRAELLLIQYGIIEGRLPKEQREQVEVKAEKPESAEAVTEELIEGIAAAPDTAPEAENEADAEPEPKPEPEISTPTPAKKGFPAEKAMPSREELLDVWEKDKKYALVGRRFGVSGDLAKRWLILAGIIDAEMPKMYRDRDKKRAESKLESKAESKKRPTGQPIENPAEGLAQIILINHENQETILRRLGDLENILLAREAREEAVYKAINAIGERIRVIEGQIGVINRLIPQSSLLAESLSEIELLAGILANVSLLLAVRGERGTPHADG